LKPENEHPENEAYPHDVPPEWTVTRRCIEKEDGRYLIYYDFRPSAQAPEVELQQSSSAQGNQ
jgi:hypothetical protein